VQIGAEGPGRRPGGAMGCRSRRRRMGDMGNFGAEGPMGDVGWGRRWRGMGKMGGESSVDGFG